MAQKQLLVLDAPQDSSSSDFDYVPAPASDGGKQTVVSDAYYAPDTDLGNDFSEAPSLPISLSSSSPVASATVIPDGAEAEEYEENPFEMFVKTFSDYVDR